MFSLHTHTHASFSFPRTENTERESVSFIFIRLTVVTANISQYTQLNGCLGTLQWTLESVFVEAAMFQNGERLSVCVLLARPLTSNVPAFSRLTWSFSGRSRKPGILLAKSTTSCTAGVKLMENSSQISWLDLRGSTYGDVFMGQTWRNVRMRGQSGSSF